MSFGCSVFAGLHCFLFWGGCKSAGESFSYLRAMLLHGRQPSAWKALRFNVLSGLLLLSASQFTGIDVPLMFGRVLGFI